MHIFALILYAYMYIYIYTYAHKHTHTHTHTHTHMHANIHTHTHNPTLIHTFPHAGITKNHPISRSALRSTAHNCPRQRTEYAKYRWTHRYMYICMLIVSVVNCISSVCHFLLIYAYKCRHACVLIIRRTHRYMYICLLFPAVLITYYLHMYIDIVMHVYKSYVRRTSICISVC